MTPSLDPQWLVVSGGGLFVGLGLLVRGLGGYRRASQITDTAPSRIASIAVGEVLVTGVVEAAELALVSPIQSVECVFYRSSIDQADEEATGTTFREERAVGFRIRDETGTLRVFPRGARFDVPLAFDDRTGTFGDEPPGLMIRSGSSYATTGRDAEIAALLTARQPAGARPSGGDEDGWRGIVAGGLEGVRFSRTRARHYREARLEPGDVVTVLGLALPFDQLTDPGEADELRSADPRGDDPEIAADLAAARAAGTLRDPEDAWGNAAIPGFGIGQPVRAPELDDAAFEPPLATAAAAERNERTFEIAPDALVLATSDTVPLVIAGGPPAVAAGRQERLFLIGLLGAILAIGSAMALAIMVGGAGI